MTFSYVLTFSKDIKSKHSAIYFFSMLIVVRLILFTCNIELKVEINHSKPFFCKQCHISVPLSQYPLTIQNSTLNLYGDLTIKPWQSLQYLTANIKERCKDDPCTVNKESTSVADGA